MASRAVFMHDRSVTRERGSSEVDEPLWVMTGATSPTVIRAESHGSQRSPIGRPVRSLASSRVRGRPRSRSDVRLPGHRRWLPIASLVACWLLTVAVAPVATAATSPNKRGITWSPCTGAPGYLCGSLEVPIDYGQPSRGVLPLAVIEHPAPDSKGVIVFNPGGPGESGVLLLPILASLVPTSVRSQIHPGELR